MERLLYLALLLFLGIGCTQQNVTPVDLGGSNSAKPTEESEGLPGYIVKPKLIKIEKRSGTTVLEAPEGSVETLGATPVQDLWINVWSVGEMQFLAVVSGHSTKVEGTLLGSIRPSESGGLNGELRNFPKDTFLVLLLSRQDGDATVLIGKSPELRPGSVFSTVASDTVSEFEPIVPEPDEETQSSGESGAGGEGESGGQEGGGGGEGGGQILCGNGVLDPGELCDGNLPHGAGQVCQSTCSEVGFELAIKPVPVLKRTDDFSIFFLGGTAAIITCKKNRTFSFAIQPDSCITPVCSGTSTSTCIASCSDPAPPQGEHHLIRFVCGN